MLTSPTTEVRRADVPHKSSRPSDAGFLLAVFIFLLFALPARLVVPSLGGLGRPEMLVAAGCLAWWAMQRAVPGTMPSGRQPIRWILYTYLFVYCLAYAAGWDRRLPGIESRAMDRAIISTFALAGVSLLVMDGIRSRRRLDQLLRRLTYGGALMALIGAIHFLTGFDLAARISVPGLELNRSLYGLSSRGAPGFRRIAGTAAHPIEFGVVAALLLPIALHFALHANSRRERRIAWPVFTVLAVAVPFSISRSAFVALATVLLVLLPVWSGRLLRQALVIGFVGINALRLLVPGLLGTIRSLFLNAGSDASVRGRTSDYGEAFMYVAERPFLGRGPRTFLPEKYMVLDNQILNSLITTGYVGLAALVLLFVGAFVTARHIYLRSRDDSARHLAQALAASLLAAFTVSFTFDSLSFSIFAGTVFLILGAVGALWRIDRESDSAIVEPPPRRILARSSAKGRSRLSHRDDDDY